MSIEFTIPEDQIKRLPTVFHRYSFQESGFCPILKSNKCPNNILCNECGHSQNTFQKASDALTSSAEKQGYQIRVIQEPLLDSKSRGFKYEFSKNGVRKTISMTQSGGVANGYWFTRCLTKTT